MTEIYIEQLTDEDVVATNLPEKFNGNFGNLVQELISHVDNKENPHTVTAEQLGLTNAYVYKGSVATYQDLLAIQNPENGWVYDVQQEDKELEIAAGSNFAWNGTSWDNLGGKLSGLVKTVNRQEPDGSGDVKLDYVKDITELDGILTITFEDDSTTELETGKVKTVNDIRPSAGGNIDINRKFYNSLEQLGLQYATVTFDAIVNAMPANSTLTFYVDVVTFQPTYAPNLSVPTSGLVIVNKGGDSSVPIEFTICSIVKAYTTYTGKYTTYNSYGFSGWIPVINKVQGLPADINGNATMYKYQEWKYSGTDATIDGFMITFAGGFSVLVWYCLFKGNNNLTVNFPKAFLTPPATMGNGIALPDRAAYIKCNVAKVTSTSCQVSHDSSGNVGTYFYSIGYSTF